MFSHIKGIQIILFLKWKIVKSPNFNTKEMVQWPMTHIHPPDTQEAAIIGMFMKTVNVQVCRYGRLPFTLHVTYAKLLT